MTLPIRAKLGWLGFLGSLLVAGLALASCGKKIPPPETTQMRLDWNLKTLVTAYEDVGNTDAKWDEPARRALAKLAQVRSQAVSADEDWATIVRTNCDAAVQAGCDDPLIRYSYIRFCLSQTNSPKALADAFCDTAEEMQQSAYPSIRKFYASLRALQQVYYAYGTNAGRHGSSQLAQNLVENLTQTLADKTTPAEEVYEACHEGLLRLSGGENWYARCYDNIEPLLLKNWPDASIRWLLKGEAYIKLAWFARGSGYADSVTEEQWKLFRERLATAAAALNRAWKLNPRDARIPLQMMTVELGQGNGRDSMESWFGRAMAINPDDYDICSSKLYYLHPKWYGSTEAMLQFGRECVQNDKWGGRVPLILVDAHYAIQSAYTADAEKADYWKQPEVWSDIKAAYTRFFALNPDAVGWYHNYAWYAYRAGQWDALNELIPKLGPVNYEFFGGREEYDRMLQLAKEHARPAALPPQ